MKIVELEQGSLEWLEFRKKGIGASDIPIIMEASPYTTRYQLWRQKLGFSEGEPENYAMRAGKAAEADIRAYAESYRNMSFSPLVCHEEENPWAFASLDGYNADNKEALECKLFMRASSFAPVLRGEIPESHRLQMIWQLLCSSANSVSYCAFCKETGQFKLHHLTRDDLDYDIFYDEVWEQANAFHSLVTQSIAPAMVKKDYDAIESEYMPIDDPAFSALAAEWIEENRKLKEATARVKQLRSAMIEFTDDGNCRGFGVRLRRGERKSPIEWSRVWSDALVQHPDLSDVDLEEYRDEQIGYWIVEEDKGEDRGN